MAKVRHLCVYCGSSVNAPKPFLDAAFQLGQLMGRADIGLVYGGGCIGLMGRVADGVLAEGGKVVGIIPGHLHSREIAHLGLSELIVVDSMHERKHLMAARSDGFAILPGGFGTLDEMFEIITWRQLGLHDKPIVLVDLDGYWQPLEAMIDRIIARQFASARSRGLYRLVGGVDEVLPALAEAPDPRLRLVEKRL